MKYKIVNGTSYRIDTPDDLCIILEGLRESQRRVTIDYGDVKTGESWGETYDISGRIGRSTGSRKIPLLIHNARSRGGGALSDNCILSIRQSNCKTPFYKREVQS